MASPERSKDAEISRLRAENQALADELAQCQADKEFVWSLWKRLQVASPDMTQAISLVLQREKEKAEIKDRKVLEILRIKDERISELDKLLTQQQQELNDFVARKIYLDEENSVLNRENRDLKEKRRSLEELLQSRESRLKTSEDLNRQVIDNLDRDKQDLTTRVTELLVESDKAKDEIHQVKKANSCLENKLKIVEADLREKTREHDRLMREHEDTLTRLQNHDIQTQKQDREDRNKERDNEKLRKELNELNALHNQCSEHASQQADLIRQLQSLQFDTQKIMKNQEEAHTMESSSLQSMYSDLNSRYQALKADFDNSERHLSTIPARNVSMQVNFAPWDAEVQVCESCVINECKMTSLQTEVDLLKERLKEKSRLIYAMDKEDPDKEYDLSLTRSKRRSMVENTGSSHFSSGNRSRSLSPMRAPLHTSSPKQRRSAGISTDKKTDDLEKLLKLKNAEIEDLRAAHDRRLARLRALQHNYNILKEQIKTYEEENSGRKKKKKMHRSDPRKLQQEDSDSVWNELAYFKGHNRNLLMERMNLQEELDLLKVQTAADAAHVGELTRCLQQEKEQLKGQLTEAERSRKIKDTERKEISEQKRKIKSLEKLLERLESESNDLIDERDNLVKEKRNLKNEISRLKQELLEKDGEVTEVRKENHYLTKKLRQRKLSRNKARRCKSVKEHQRALNRSIQHMSALFSDFDEDGWEEISTDSGGEETGDSLGDRIVRTATSPDLTCRTLDRSLRRRRRRHDSSGKSISPRSITKPSKRQAASIHGHIKRLAKRYEVNESERKLKWSNIGVQTDDEAPKPCNHLTVIGVGDNSVTDYTNNTTIDTTIVRRRDIATSPHMGLAKLGKSLNRSHRLESPSMSSLKQRLGSLQQQVTVLRDSKALLQKSLNDEKESKEHLQSDLSVSNQRLKISKQTIQKLTQELDNSQAAKETLERQLETKIQTLQDAEIMYGKLPTSGNGNKRTESEWKQLESKLKNSTTEISKQASVIKTFKSENESHSEQIKTLQEKINKLERDITQKRTLIEDLRSKVKAVQEDKKTNAETIKNLEDKIKSMSGGTDQKKSYVESLKKRVTALTTEKHQYEELYFKANTELEKKTKQLISAQNRKTEAENTAVELETAAAQQLHGLASRSESTIETIKGKLKKSHARIQELNQFVKFLASELLNQVHDARDLVKQAKKSKLKNGLTTGVSMSKAHSLASSILNMSETDIEDFMNSTDGTFDEEMAAEGLDDHRRDSEWHRRWQAVLSSKVPFAKQLMEVLMEKVSERDQLLSKVELSQPLK